MYPDEADAQEDIMTLAEETAENIPTQSENGSK